MDDYQDTFNKGIAADYVTVDYMDAKVARRDAEITRLRAEVAELRDWIRQEGVNSDTCTYNVLGEVCEGCNCTRRPLPPAPTTEAT